MMLNNFSRIKNTKSKKIHYSPTIHGFTNVCRGRPEYRSFRILLDSVYSSPTINKQTTKKRRNKYTPVKSTKCITQVGNFTTNSMVKV